MSSMTITTTTAAIATGGRNGSDQIKTRGKTSNSPQVDMIMEKTVPNSNRFAAMLKRDGWVTNMKRITSVKTILKEYFESKE